MFGLLTLWLATSPVHACGGFFCSGGTTTTTTTTTGDFGVVPVVQDAERILFRVNDDETITTFVEVSYQQREDVEFAWIIPIPDVIPVEEVSTADAGLFNALEVATAPRFTFQWVQQNVNYGYGGGSSYGYYNYNYGGGRSGGCGLGCAGGKDSYGDSASFATTATSPGGYTTTVGTVEEEIGVEVVEEAVVGPFAIEVITAIDAPEFADWLAANAYDLPDGAVDPLQHYIDGGYAFLGVKLAPDVPDGPIDTLVFTCPAEAPQIPLILTSIASADDLTIQAWVLANEPHVPTNWVTTDDIATETLPNIDTGGTDYLPRVQAAISAHDGQAFALEYAGPTDDLVIEDLIAEATVKQYPYLTRYRGFVHPWEMTVDPEFGPFPGLPDYSNEHFVELGFATGETPPTAGQGAWLVLLPLPLLVLLRRRRD